MKEQRVSWEILVLLLTELLSRYKTQGFFSLICNILGREDELNQEHKPRVCGLEDSYLSTIHSSVLAVALF